MSVQHDNGRAVLTVLWSPDGHRPFDADTIAGLRDRCPGPVAGVGAPFERAGLDAWYPQGSDVLDRIASGFPDRPALLLRPGLRLPRRLFDLVETCRGRLDEFGAVAFPGNYDARVDPFPGLATDVLDLDAATYWCAERRGQWIEAPPCDCLLLAAGNVRGDPARAVQMRALLVDDGYVVDPERARSGAGADDKGIDGGRDDGEAPLGALRMRIQALIDEDPVALPPPEPRPVTLHITHSWGGGVWRWIDDLAVGDPGNTHLVLVAVSDNPGRTCGRHLRLCAGGPGRGIIGEYALTPWIGAVAERHEGYAQHLEDIVRRFGVGRIIVSSLIGHSLDCLRTGVPTLAVLHDFFPLWPLLDRDPLPFVERAGGDPARSRAIAVKEHPGSIKFEPTGAGSWDEIARAWHEAVAGVALVAPTRHVIDRIRALAGDPDLKIERVPHGFRPFESTTRALRPSPDARLHLVIPGRLTTGKGLRMLGQALPRLADRVRLTALGCGREGLELMGRAGIDLVPEYRREALPELVAALKPHAALLLSTVPETWSYTLSEMRALGLAPVATRVGAFAERIDDGRDGILFEPDTDSLVAVIEALAERPERLEALAAAAEPERSTGDVGADIERIVPTAMPSVEPEFRPMSAREATDAMLAGRLASARKMAGRAEREGDRMRRELAERTRWAETMERQFRSRTEWALRLDAQVTEQAEALQRRDHEYEALSQQHRELVGRHEELGRQHDDLQRQHDDLQRQHDDLQRQHDDLQGRHDDLRGQFDLVVGSRSWKLTRPLRVGARVLRNARSRGVVNPLAWPRLVARLVHHLRLRGLKATLMLMQAQPLAREEPVSVAPERAPESESVAEPVAFAESPRPLASIVVPVYNQLHFTAACLESLASVETGIEFEVVVVDDASTDSTAEWLEKCAGVRVERNRSNAGFIGACNRGAKAARGRYLVFLNNDTRVTDHWLDALVSTFERNPDAGIAGARLVFADGSLQEAGGIVFRDGSGWNFGRGDHPDKPQYGFVSEADYVSGACLAIERATFEAVGGFDTRYAPAYYEDTDLCFRVRERDLKVVYQPAAIVVHFEGATSGTDEQSGTKRYQAINREDFRQRWAGALAAHPENPGRFSPEAARRFRYRRFERRALVVDAVTPMPDHDSGSVRLFAILRLLGELGYQTSFMPWNLAWTGRHSLDLQQAGIEVLTSPWLEDPEDWLTEHGPDLDLVVVSRYYVLAPLVKLIRNLCPAARLVFDTVDLHFLREQREAELAGTSAAGRAAERTRGQELALVREADATLVVSEYERALLGDLEPDARVSVVSNIHSVKPPGKPFEERHGMVFVGGFQHPPNLDAVEWLIDEILPGVLRELPEITLHIIGSRMPERLLHRREPGLQVHGFVPDLTPYMTGCRISVAPLRFGAGVKGKVNQAMSHGLPVVATSCAAEGMYAEDGRELLIADDARSFAAEVCRLYRDHALWQRLAKNGRINVERHFSLDAARKALKAVLAELEHRD